MKNTCQALMVSHLAPADRRTPGATQPERSAKNPPVRVICLLLLAGWLTCQSPAAAQSPTIIAGPANQVVAVGGTVTLGVTAGGPAPAYQWFKDSRLILGATNYTLTVTNAGIANSGMYYVVVTNRNGMIISLPASVTVGIPSLLAWGSNGSGQLGNGTTNDAHTPIVVASNVVAGTAGGSHSLFVTTDGTLWAMGYNYYGQLGNGTTSNTNRPVSVASNVVAVAAGANHSLFVKTDGTLWTMGNNYYGELGNGTTTDAHTPISVASNVVAVAAGTYHSLFVKTNGTLWAMGRNFYGQLGNGTTTDAHTPISVASNVVAVAAGGLHSLFVKTDGTLWAMGWNSYGQLGNGTTTDAHTPISVANNVVAVAAGGFHSLFVMNDGTLRAMGRDSEGQIGLGGGKACYTMPLSVASNVVAVAAGYYHSLFVKTNGTLWAMGNNSSGQLGNGTTTVAYKPISVPHLSVANIFPADMAYHSLALLVINPVTVTLGNLTQTYTGSAISVTVSTTPPGLTVNLTYNGSPFAPTNVGSYTVIGTVSDPYYAGGATNTLVINPATATVTLSNLNQFFTGSAISVSVNTTPPGLSVNLTYNGSPFAPTNVGNYTVIGNVSTPNYAGSATNTLFIMPSNAVSVCSAADLRAAVSNGGNIIFACNGTLSLSNEITVTTDATLDASGRAVVLSGMGSNRLFRINAGRTLTLINLTLRDGLAAGTNGVLSTAGGDGAGGAILNQGGTLNAINCSFLSNTAQGGQGDTQNNQNVPGAGGNAFGGAVVNQGGWVSLTNSVFGNNIAAGGQGGEGGLGEGGMGGSSFGGAVYSDGGVVVADNCIFQTNSSAAGGGGDGYFWGLAGDGSGGAIFNTNSALKLIRTVLSNNTCTGGWGGGRANGGAVYHDTGTFEAVDSLFQMNSANGGGGTDWYRGKPPGNGKGGALWISVASSDISGCSFVSNSAVAGTCITPQNACCGAADAAGGAIYNRQTLAIENSTFYADSSINILFFMGITNVNPTPGGAIYNDGGSGVLTHVTAVSAAITSSTNGSITFRNCILNGGDGGGNLIDGGGNISSDGTPVFTQPTSFNNLDPQLGTLSYQGGPTPTVPLLPGSPAIDAACSQWCLATDQRGYPRPLGNGCDIGAVEAWPSNSIFGRISGYAISSNGITVMSGAISAPVQPDGTYSLPGLPVGASVVAPKCADAIFVPSNRVVNMPPDATGVDFYSYRSNALMILPGSNNTMQVLFAGQPSGTYRVLMSSNISIWFPFATNTLTSDGLLQFVETNQPGYVERFFRTVRP